MVWFTGLSGSGKSTIANLVERSLFERGCSTFLLDGDNVRHSLCATPKHLLPEHGEAFSQRFGLGFSSEDREENIRRVGCAAQLFASAGMIVLTAFVSPYRRDRDRVRRWVNSQRMASASDSAPSPSLPTESRSDFVEVFVDTPIELCEKRDPKGLYQQARQGKIPNFTGISDPYQPPEFPELRLDGGSGSPEWLCDQVVEYLIHAGYLPGRIIPKRPIDMLGGSDIVA